MAVSIDQEALKQLNTKEADELNKAAESLDACGVGRVVSLPQIIVVGDQSTGKSSVLEAISHVRFPVEGGLCTRFATELVFRQAPETRVDVSIKFATSFKSPHTFSRTGFSQDDLPSIIKEAKEHMGFNSPGLEFSKDVLRLVIEGPTMLSLTLVDLPGLFHSDTATQSMHGKGIVTELVERYMEMKNSIILVVVDAATDLARQDCLHRVRACDPQRERTIGVITKPDRTLPDSHLETTYIKLAKNQEKANRLRLGWHVLRNKGDNETDVIDRDAHEKQFFERGAWASIPKHDVGIVKLREKLGQALFEHRREVLPQLVKKIIAKLEENQEELAQLGEARSTDGDRRSFLLNIAGDFQRLARDGIYGHYSDAFFGDLDNEDRKLRAQLRNFSRTLNHVLKTKGCTQKILPAEVHNEDTRESTSSMSKEDVPKYLEDFMRRYPYEFPEPESVTEKELDAQLRRQASVNQGREFPGSPNHQLVIQLFQRQSEPWKEIATFHVKRVLQVAQAFVDELFQHLVGPVRTCKTTEAILINCVDPFFENLKKDLTSKLEELLRPYVEGFALPLDADLYRTMRQKATDGLSDRLYNALVENQQETFGDNRKGWRINEKIIANAVEETKLEGDEFGTRQVIGMMVAYYEVSRRTFTDNVVNLAIESCLVRHIPDILTPAMVGVMDTEMLKKLAAESEASQSRREYLRSEEKILRDGLKICQDWRRRGSATSRSSTRLELPAEASNTRQTSSASSNGQTNGKLAPKENPVRSRSETRSPAAARNFSGSTSGSIFSTPATPATAPPKPLFGAASVITSAAASPRPFAGFGAASPATPAAVPPKPFAGFGAASPATPAAASPGPFAGFGAAPPPAGSSSIFGSAGSASSPNGVFGGGARTSGNSRGGLFGGLHPSASATPAPSPLANGKTAQSPATKKD